jgi:Protein of unknown function (DUF1570)
MCRRTIAIVVSVFACLTSQRARAAAAPAPATPELRGLESRHYFIHTDLDRALAEDLARRMDAMFDDYSRRLADFNPDRRAKFEVYLFARRSDYMKFTNGRVPNTGGVFMPARDALAAFLEGQGRDALRRTLQHEAFHQFAYSAISHDLSPWINEGLATVFEEGIFMGRSFSLGQVPPRRVRQLQADIRAKRLIGFETMMKMSLDDWGLALSRETQRNMIRGATQYNQAWAMCHFLIFATPPNSTTPIFRKRFLDMLGRIHGGADCDSAFTASFSDNIKGFQDLFLDFAKSLSATSEASMIERQDILADLLVALNDRGQRFNAMDEFRNALSAGGYRMSYQKGDVRWQTDTDPTTYFKNLDGTPLGADEMYLSPRSGAALPDLVLHAPRQIPLRTVFHDSPNGRIEHEMLIDAPAR